MRLRFSSLTLLLLTAVSASAQMPGADIVKTTAAVKGASVKHGKTGMLAISVTVAPEYHINAPRPNDPDLIPTTFTGGSAAGVTFGAAQFPAPRSVKASYAKKPMLVYMGHVTILVPFTVAKTAKPGPIALTGTLNYQGCNSQSCFPPATAPIHAFATIK